MPLPAPQNLVVTYQYNAEDNVFENVIATWDAVDGASGYTLNWDVTGPEFGNQSTGTTTELTFGPNEFGTFAPETEIWFKVTANDGEELGDPSETFHIRFPIPGSADGDRTVAGITNVDVYTVLAGDFMLGLLDLNGANTFGKLLQVVIGPGDPENIDEEEVVTNANTFTVRLLDRFGVDLLQGKGENIPPGGMRRIAPIVSPGCPPTLLDDDGPIKLEVLGLTPLSEIRVYLAVPRQL